MLLPASFLAGIMVRGSFTWTWTLMRPFANYLSTVHSTPQMFIWPICTTKTALIVFAIVYGMACGAFVSLFSPGVAQLGEVRLVLCSPTSHFLNGTETDSFCSSSSLKQTHDVGRRMGMLTTCLSLAALVGPPISGAILTATGGSYMHVAGFSGSVVFAGTALMFWARYLVLGGLKGRM
jgi:MCP family monocarboxylic acid transporter-like MFS transporter 10